MQNRPLLIALGVTLLSAQAGIAEENSKKNFYADIGYSRLGPNLLDLSFDATFEYGGIGGHAGYRFSEHWSVEGEATFGVENDKQFFSGFDEMYSVREHEKTNLDHLIGIYMRGDVPITGKLNAFGRFGMAKVEIDYSSSTLFTDLETEETTSFSYDETISEIGVALGMGLTYDLTDKIYLRSDYKRFALNEAEMDSVRVGIGLRF